jgi:flavin reductase (DIM6/NTAB) family NADH-FMN oxidoreductase RutF
MTPTRCLATPGGPPGLFGRHTTNVTLVTMRHQGAPVGVLVTSLASISSTPPLISFNLSTTSSAWTALEPAEHIGLHLLAAGQEAVADSFAPGVPAGRGGFSGPAVGWHPGPHAVPILDGCAAWSVARPQQRIHAGSHVIIVARLLQGEAREDAVPLLKQADAYHHLVS